MNDKAQETTAEIATLVEHKLLGTSVLPVEGGEKKKDHTTSYINFTEIITNITNITALKFLQ